MVAYGNAVGANVAVTLAGGLDSCRAASVRKTTAIDGAFTGILQVPTYLN